MMKKRTAFVMVTIIAAALSVAVMPTAANAATAPPATRPASPGAGYAWGAPHSSLPNAAECTDNVFPTSGGWGKRTFPVTDAWPSRVFNDTKTIPWVFRLEEPCITATNVLNFGGRGTRLAPDTGVTRSAQIGFGNGVPITTAPHPSGSTLTQATDGYVECATTEWSLAANRTKRNMSAGSYLNMSGSTVHDQAIGPNGFFATLGTTCPYIVSISLRYVDMTANEGYAQAYTTWWFAETFFQSPAYKGYDKGDPLVTLCSVPGVNSSDCAYLDPDINGTSFDEMCANQPSTAWLDFSWIGPVIGHYARCLFVPANGWDPDATLTTAWENSMPMNTINTLEGVGSEWDWGEGCGPIVDGSAVFDGFVLNSCSWSSWAGDAKVYLRIVIIGLAAWAIIMWVAHQAVIVFIRDPELHPGRGGSDE